MAVNGRNTNTNVCATATAGLRPSPVSRLGRYFVVIWTRSIEADTVGLSTRPVGKEKGRSHKEAGAPDDWMVAS